MSLRDSCEQSQYETWTFDVVDACRAAGVEPPCDFAMRWYRGETVEEIVREMGGIVKVVIPDLPRVTTQVRKLNQSLFVDGEVG